MMLFVRSFARPIGRAVTADYLRSTFSPGRRLPVQASVVPGPGALRHCERYGLNSMSSSLYGDSPMFWTLWVAGTRTSSEP